jgi:hypothetical protein
MKKYLTGIPNSINSWHLEMRFWPVHGFFLRQTKQTQTGDTKQNDQEYYSDSWRACSRDQLVPRGQRSGSFRSRYQKDGSK